ncbi:MAG: DUF547 domain-containing protein [Saprospiraceae bacterium]|nr:DUF547 domain-containing protein [Saprospiraceae bacterium]
MKSLILLIVSGIFIAGCGTNPHGKGPVISHHAWTKLLKKHVNDEGLVNYKGFVEDKAILQLYLDDLSANPPGDHWSANDKIAYWLNAYNAFTVKLIVDYYPIQSIKDIGPENQVIFVNTPWDKNIVPIGNKTITLNGIEHGILRKRFKEPRIHFALNCASISCPVLRNEAYQGSTLDHQLNDQAIRFFNDPLRNQPDPYKPQISPILNWYGGDLKKWSGLTLNQYINQYATTKLNDDAPLSYLTYDWGLNDQQ